MSTLFPVLFILLGWTLSILLAKWVVKYKIEKGVKGWS